MKHNFTFLVWEFVNNRSAREAYFKVPNAHKPTKPPGFKKPTAEQDKALRSDSAKKLNAQIRKEWPESAVEIPFVARRPNPDWPSRP